MSRLGLSKALAIGLALAALGRSAARGDIDPLSGIDFVSVTSPGNAPWPGTMPPTSGDRAVGRGRVDYAYSIGRFEVTTAQWVEFYNAAFDRPPDDRLPHLIPPTFWGAASTMPNTPGGQRWRVPAGNEMLPVGNISWRMAAMYCNWLHNGKSAERSAFLNGAYDVSTFSYQGASGIFNDQLTHNAGARYWIPTWDEWLKAAHYDPNKNGQGEGGWWVYPHKSDSPPVYGPPGAVVNGQLAQANAGWNSSTFPGNNPFGVPLGAYLGVESAWGLMDVAGGSAEWTEEVILVSGMFPVGRVYEGSFRSSAVAVLADRIQYSSGDFSSLSTFDLGLRIASSVPAPATCVPMILFIMLHSRRTRRERNIDEHADRHRFMDVGDRGGGAGHSLGGPDA